MRTFIKNNYLVTLDVSDLNSPCIMCFLTCICQNKTVRVPDKLLQVIDICLTNNIKYISNNNFYIKNIASENYYKLIL